MLHGNSLSDRRSLPASKADMENDVDAPKLPFFFPDKDSICHEVICSLLVRISMISDNSTMQHSPWCNLYTRLSTDTTKPYDEGPAEYIFFWYFFFFPKKHWNTVKHCRTYKMLVTFVFITQATALMDIQVSSCDIYFSDHLIWSHTHSIIPNTSVICPPVNSIRK